MKTIADPQVLETLQARLVQLTPGHRRRWGKMSAAEMLCHLGDASDLVLGRRIPEGPRESGRPRPLMKWLALKAPLRWPHGYPTRPGIDPQREGTKPAADRMPLEALRCCSPTALPSSSQVASVRQRPLSFDC